MFFAHRSQHLLPAPGVCSMNLPVERWSWSSTIGTITAVIGALGILTGVLWTYAGVTYAAQSIPAIKQQQDDNTRDIAVLKEARRNADQQYSEILSQLTRLNDKFDRLNEAKK